MPKPKKAPRLTKEAIKAKADRAEGKVVDSDEAYDPLNPPERGRPTKYKAEYVEQAKKLCRLGATDAELADFFKVAITTVWRWQSRYEDFCNATKVGGDHSDDRVERSLFQRAIGYTYDAVKIMQFQGKEVIVPYQEHVPPETAAASLWLRNRRPAKWRDKTEQDVNVRTHEQALEQLEMAAGIATAHEQLN